MAEGGSFLNRGVGEPGRRAFLDLRREIQSVDDRLSAYVGFPNPFPDDVTFEGDVTVNEDLTVGGVVDASTFLGDLQGAVHVRVKNVSGVTLVKGSPVFATGSVGASGEVEVRASLAGTASTMPALGLLDESLVANGEGSATVLGVVRLVDTSLYAVNDELYVGVSGGLTNVRPSGASELVQKIGRVVRSDASTGEVLVLGAGRTNDVPNGLSPTITLAGDASGSVTLTDLADGTLTVALSTPVITDHGGLGGLGDDDHPQYHDDARGDARYLQLSGGSLSGSLVVSGTVTVGAFTLPATDGLANQVLVTDGSGGVSWQNQAGGGGSPGGSDGQIQYNNGGAFGGASALYYDDVNSRVGIGTTSPETPLNIVTTNKLGATFTGTTDGEGVRVDQSNYTAGNYVSLVEGSYDDFATEPHVRIGAMYDGAGSHLAFGTSNAYGSGITNTAMFIDENGNVGIGTTSPNVPLTVEHNNTYGMSLASTGTYSFLTLSDATSTGYNYVGLGALGDELRISAGGSQRMTIDSSGNVGIGTTTPQAPLSFANSTGNKIDLFHNTAGSGDRYGFEIQPSEFRIHSGAGGTGSGGITFGKKTTSTFTENVRITNDGNVGIGTTSPNVDLHVSAGTSGDAEVRIEADTDNNNEGDVPYLSFAADGGILEGVIGLNDNTMTFASSVSSNTGFDFRTGTTNYYTNGLDVITNTTSRVFIDADGDVGIGTTSPSYKLDVVGNIRTQNSSGANAKIGAWQANAIYAMFGTDDMAGAEYCVLGGGSTDGNTYISAQSGAGVYIRPSANSTTNQALFTTSGTTLGSLTCASMVSTGNSGVNGYFYLDPPATWIANESSSFSSTSIRFGTSAIRTPTYVYTSSVSSSNNDYYSYSDNSYGGYGGQYHFKADTTVSQTSVGNAAVTAGRFFASNTSVGSTSDQRLKKDIQDLDQGVALAILNQLRPRTYEWDKEDFTGLQPHGTQIGFVAQEVDEVFPAWVDWWPEDNVVRESDGEVVSKPLALGFDQQFDAMVVAAIQNLSERIEALETT